MDVQVDFGFGKLTPEEMLALRPSEESQDYVEILIEKSKVDALTEAEQAELDYFVQYDHMLRLMQNHAAKVVAASRAA